MSSTNLELVGKDDKGGVLFRVDLDQARIVTVGALTENQGKKRYQTITVEER